VIAHHKESPQWFKLPGIYALPQWIGPYLCDQENATEMTMWKYQGSSKRWSMSYFGLVDHNMGCFLLCCEVFKQSCWKDNLERNLDLLTTGSINMSFMWMILLGRKSFSLGQYFKCSNSSPHVTLTILIPYPEKLWKKINNMAVWSHSDS
jgi:hypothetical protein